MVVECANNAYHKSQAAPASAWYPLDLDPANYFLSAALTPVVLIEFVVENVLYLSFISFLLILSYCSSLCIMDCLVVHRAIFITKE